ncbi:nucleotidyltransferase domain-containing protein (plasmid) [Deinococcus radiomollis]|uniref:hypothetical protein n=1 Tax=Deinococcus radiomollis TaxID=468916 RepID=UPI003892A027
MSQPPSWRWAYARRLADAYERQPEVRAVMVGGSVARGTDDRFSDLELGVFWAADPTEDARTAAILDAGADLQRLYPQEAGL